jgi:hypothetical protein
MTSTYTTNKGFDKPAIGDDVGTWGNNVNSDWDIADKAFGGNVSYALTSSTTSQAVTKTDAQNQRITLTGNTGSSYTFVGVGSITGTVLTITAVTSGTLTTGSVINGSGVSAGTVISNQLSGTTGGVGTYTVSISQGVPSTVINANNGTIYLTFDAGFSGMWIVINNTTGPAAIYAYTAASGSQGVYLTQGIASLIYSDGTNVGFADNRFNTNSIGATGGGSDAIFFENGQTVTTSYTIPSTVNAMSAGPISINSGVTVTVNAPTVWTIV